MRGIGDRLRELRTEKRLTQKALAARVTRAGHKIGQTGIGEIETGKVERPRCLPELVEILETSEDWLLHEVGAKHPTKANGQIPAKVNGALRQQERVVVAGYIGAGGEVAYDDGYAKGAGLDKLDPPPDEKRTIVGLVVRGVSQLPLYQDGDVVFYSREPTIPPGELINDRCVVRLREPDGRTLLKTLRPGSKPKLFTLTSLNADDMPDIEIEWAAPVLWIKPARRPKATSLKRAGR